MSRPGRYGADVTVPFSDLEASLYFHKFHYKEDDRTGRSTSPIDQRTILLRGLDFDSYLYHKDLLGLGLEMPLVKGLSLSAIYARLNGVLLFSPDDLPGKNKQNETKIETQLSRVQISFTKDSLLFHFGAIMENRNTKNIRDNWNTFGSRNIGKYDHGSTSFFVAAGLNI